jgi:hypothetical protein
MDKGHIRSAWPPHSYENLYFLQERYESVVLSRQMVDQIRPILTLHHKESFMDQFRNEAKMGGKKT